MKRTVLLVDNKDSFVFNLAESFERLGAPVRVLRNPADPARIFSEALRDNTLIVLSPGPGHPKDAGGTIPLLTLARGRVPVLGVCFGHQAMVLEAGGVVEGVGEIVHGKASFLEHDGAGPFAGLPSPMPVARYHSLCTRIVPERFHISAHLTTGGLPPMAMAIHDPTARQIGLQFHPESILTPDGDRLLRNVLEGA